MAAETAARAAAAVPAAALSEGDGAPPLLRAALAETVDELAGEIVDLSRDIHSHPEVGYAEHHAVAAVAGLLRAHGVEPTVGVYGMDTALRAVVGPTTRADPGPVASAPVCDTAARVAVPADSAPAAPSSDPIPVIAILAEYDALPGIGHACGHNVMCANSVGAFLALVELARRDPAALPGRVVLQTTPAEEPDTAKEILSRRGMLDGVDAAIQTHSYAYDLVDQTWLGVRRIRAVFTGVPAHAASQPFMGRNALDAATVVLMGIGLLRQQILPMDRLHAVVVDGGRVPNVVPERSELNIFVRSKYPETLKDMVGRVEDVLRGAALMTGTGLEIITPPYTNEMPVRSNGPLGRSWVRSQRERGRTRCRPASCPRRSRRAPTSATSLSVCRAFTRSSRSPIAPASPCTRARWSGRPGAPPETRRPWTARTAWRPSPWTGCTTAVSVGLCEPISRPAAPSTSSTSGRSDARPQPLLLERSAGPRHVR